MPSGVNQARTLRVQSLLLALSLRFPSLSSAQSYLHLQQRSSQAEPPPTVGPSLIRQLFGSLSLPRTFWHERAQ